MAGTSNRHDRGKGERSKRLAEALRANLKRRKAQPRSAATGSGAGPGELADATEAEETGPGGQPAGTPHEDGS